MVSQRSLPFPARLPAMLLPALMLACLAPGPARTASLPPLEARRMVAQSPVIVHGTVVSMRSRWNDDRSLIVTETRLRVHDTLKGAAGGEITVLVPGGTMGKLQVEVPGAALFATGTETVVFLVPDGRGNLYVHGLSRGRLDVRRDAASGRKTVPGLSPELLQAIAEVSPAAKASAGPPELQTFLAGLRTLVRDVDAKGDR